MYFNQTEVQIDVEAQAIDLSDYTFTLVINIVILLSTFISCTGAMLGPIAAASCILNVLATLATLSLSILVGTDILLPPDTTFDSILEDVKETSWYRAIESVSQEKSKWLVEKLSENYSFSIKDDSSRCLVIDLSTFNFESFKGVRHEVCLTSAGYRTLRKSTPMENLYIESFGLGTIGQPNVKVTKTKGFTETLKGYSQVTLASLNKLYDKFFHHSWEDGRIEVSISDDDENTLFSIALELI